VFISSVSSCSLCATLHMKLSVSCSHRAQAVFSYMTVDVICLCPSIFWTWRRSLVSWYSIVPFQCLRVWNPIFWSLALLSFSASCLR